MSNFQEGDRVYVTDPGLAQMREIMRRATGTAPPNHIGTVAEFWDDGETVLIAFDEDGVEGGGNAAPYTLNEVRLLSVSGQPCAVWRPSSSDKDRCICGFTWDIHPVEPWQRHKR